jgi:VIT1/CCC1 family predicted Fe2+/Mn2+ transporter
MSLGERWNEERQAQWLYAVVADVEPDASLSTLFKNLARAAGTQAEIIETELERGGENIPAFRPQLRTRVVAGFTRLLGPRRVRPMLAAMKVRGLSAYLPARVVGSHPLPTSVEDVGESHRHGSASSAGNVRAAVFGANDGLVSNTSLIMGVAGATGDPKTVLISGVAGLLAGSFSMAAGEYVSVRSQRELYEHQIAQEREELEQYPEEEAEELALIYNARGIPMDQARGMASIIFDDPDQALRTLAIEELGVNPDDLASPIEAAASSFVAFAMGAGIPLVPYLFAPGPNSLLISAGAASVALFAVGVAISLFSGKNAIVGGARMLAIGLLAGFATYAIGSILGVSLG